MADSNWQERKKQAIGLVEKAKNCLTCHYSIRDYHNIGPLLNQAILDLNISNMPFELPYESTLIPQSGFSLMTICEHPEMESAKEAHRNLDVWKAYLEKLEEPEESKPEPALKHSPDFRAITAKIKFELTEDQAKVVKMLWEARNNGIDSLSGDEILVEIDLVDKNFTKKMKEVFKRSPAWNSLVISPKRGFYKLNIE